MEELLNLWKNLTEVSEVQIFHMPYLFLAKSSKYLETSDKILKRRVSHFSFSNQCARAKALRSYLYIEVKLQVKTSGSFSAPGTAQVIKRKQCVFLPCGPILYVSLWGSLRNSAFSFSMTLIPQQRKSCSFVSLILEF